MKLILSDICKSFGSLTVLDHVCMELDSSRVWCLTGPSGSGKTTLFRIIMGLETADSGEISGIGKDTRIAAVFQEDRLCENFTPAENVMMASGKAYEKEQVREELLRILPAESLDRPVSTLSGGQKRRTAICRALLAPSDIILMDEPFTGLDEDTRNSVSEYILEKSSGKLLFISTHHEEDIYALNAVRIDLAASGR